MRNQILRWICIPFALLVLSAGCGVDGDRGKGDSDNTIPTVADESLTETDLSENALPEWMEQETTPSEEAKIALPETQEAEDDQPASVDVSALQETESPLPTGYDGILSSEYVVLGENYYCITKRREKVGTISMPTVISLDSGDVRPLCPDPLCPHDSPAVCPYVNVNTSFPIPFCAADEHTFFVLFETSDGSCRMDRLDTASGSVHMVCRASREIRLLCVEDKTVWATFDGLLVGYDTETDAEFFRSAIPSGTTPHFIRDGKVYCSTIASLFVTDPAFTEDYGKISVTGPADAWYYDTTEGSFWINTEDEQGGAVHVYRDGGWKRVDLPEDNIFCFALTAEKIYFSPYDPKKIRGATDKSGGKIYAVDRKNPNGEAELIYTAGEGEPLCSPASHYVVLDSSLFYSGIKIEVASLSIAGDLPKIWIDLNTGERREMFWDER